jgi:outer membrane protein
MKSGFLVKLLGALLAFGALTAFASPAAAESKIAVVDTQRAIMETEDGLRAQATLKKLFDKRQRELDKKQVDLQKEREDIEKQKNVLSKAALQKRIEKWQREMMSLQGVFVEYNKELQKKQNELTQPIFQKAMGIIRRLATQDGYDIVVDKQAVPYVRSDLDLTDKIITMYNQGGGGTPDPKAGANDKRPGLPKGPTLKAPAKP